MATVVPPSRAFITPTTTYVLPMDTDETIGEYELRRDLTPLNPPPTAYEVALGYCERNQLIYGMLYTDLAQAGY